MSADIGPGDFVEAIVDYGDDGPRQGEVVQIAWVDWEPCEICPDCGDGEVTVGLREYPLDRASMRWCPCDLRPIYRPKPDAFTDLLKVPDRKRVTA